MLKVGESGIATDLKVGDRFVFVDQGRDKKQHTVTNDVGSHFEYDGKPNKILSKAETVTRVGEANPNENLDHYKTELENALHQIETVGDIGVFLDRGEGAINFLAKLPQGGKIADTLLKVAIDVFSDAPKRHGKKPINLLDRKKRDQYLSAKEAAFNLIKTNLSESVIRELVSEIAKRQQEKTIRKFIRTILESAQNSSDEGEFLVHYSSQVEPAVVEDISAKIHTAIEQCRSAGLPITDKLYIELRRASGYTLADYSVGSNPPTIGITSKAYKRPDLVSTLVHELGHYIHDKIVPDGKNNVEIQSRYSWAVAEIQTPRPRKGAAFEFQYRGGWLDYSHSNRPYPMMGEIIGKGRGKNVRVLILKYPTEILDDPKLGLSFHGDDGNPLNNPVVELDLDKLLYKGKQTDKEDRSYEGHQHDWIPTAYSKKNSNEWFAELVTTFVLGHLSEAPSDWLRSIIKTGKA